MLENLARTALLGVVLMSGSCGGTVCWRPGILLTPGGVRVSYVNRGDCTGCEMLARGDLILAVDGVSVATVDDLAHLTDGQAHELEFWDADADRQSTATIVAAPNGSSAPIKDAPPLWLAGVNQLRKAPSWAQRRLFGHASPRLLLVNDDDGTLISGRDLYGGKRLLVLFDWATSEDRYNAALCMQVLQKAQADLRAKGVEIMFAQVRHPSSKNIRKLDDLDLQVFFEANQIGPEEGGPLPPPPFYRMPNKAEQRRSPGLGLEGELRYLELLGEAPNIVVLDERGIIRWHSAGAVPDPSGELPVDMVFTINHAVLFARDDL